MKPYIAVFMFVLTISCKDFSGLFIDDGALIGQSNSVAGVFKINTNNSECTAQAVSANLSERTMTAITAAHCVDKVSSPTSQITTGAMSGATSRNIYFPQEYSYGGELASAYDMAVIVFENIDPVGFFSLRHTLDTLKTGEQFYMVGYSDHNIQGGQFGPKAWGQNVVQALARGDITINSSGTQGHTVSPGDSGGGAFTSCKLMGVASRYVSSDRTGKDNLHTNLLWTGQNQNVEGNFRYLENIQRQNPNAYICGLHGWDERHCPLSHLFYQDRDPSQGNFVCRSAS